MRRLLLLGLALLTSAPVCVYALSLGNLELRSGLHQPFDARVPILSATGDEIETLRVQVASSEEFARAGVNYAGILTQLKFEIQQTRKGPDYIRITSRDPVNEPFLNFLVEANWSKGRLIREFTALLDPPLYDPSRRVAWEPARIKAQPAAPAAREIAAAPTPATSPPAATTAPVQPSTVAAAPGPEPSAAPVRTPDTSGSYPTLWSAATAMRPDNSVSMQQMMVALLRTNPEAFIRGNINLLKKGYVLKMPEQGEISAISRAEAIAEVRKHHSLWREYRERGSIAAPKQPKGATSVAANEPAQPAPAETPAATTDAEAAAAEEAKLKLLAGNDATSTSPTGEGSSTGSGDLALTKEALESKERENEELRSQLKDSEDIIDKLKSRVTLQDSQLAELQQRLGTAATETTTPPAQMPATETPTAESPVISQSPAPGQPEKWRALDDVVQTPTYPFPDTPAAAEEAAPPEEPAPEATAEPPADTVAESPPAETPPAEAPTIETPPEPTPTEATTTDETTAAEEPPPAEEGTPATAETDSEESVAEEPPPEPVAETTEPAADGGLVAKVNGIVSPIIPSSILDAIPGGALTLLGGLLAAVGGIAALAMRRRAEPVPDTFPTAAEDDSFDRALTGASSDIGETTASMNEDDLFGSSGAASAADDLLDLDMPSPGVAAEIPVAAPTTPVKSEPDEDPLAEVNVYLAYERFDEAERLIREAITNHPNEHKYKLRLLEVYYSSNNKRAYEGAARELQVAVHGNGPLWDSAVAMWREMSPNRELFEGGDDLASTLGEAGQRQFVDITALAEDAVSRTVTSAVTPGLNLSESSISPTATELPGDGPLAFDPGTETDQAFDMLDITAAGDVRQADNDILDLSASPAVSGGVPDPSSIEGASEAVNELLSLTKSGAVVPSADSAASLMESSLDFEAALLGGEEPGRASTMGPNDLLDFDLGSIAEPTAAKPADNVVDFPGRSEPSVTPIELTTLIDVAPVTSAEPTSAEAPAPATVVAETGLEFDIGGLDLSLDFGGADETRGPDRDLDLKLDSRGSAEVTMGDIDSLSLDEDTVRLFENDLASTNAQDTAPIFGADADLTATGGDFGPLDDAFRESATTGGDELTLDSEGDDLTLDDITKSLENTVGARSAGKYGASLETVDLTVDSRSLLDAEQTAELFENDLRGTGVDDAFGTATSTLGTAAGDDIDTKLNLAKAYIELGDASGARAILDEVVRDGVDEQRDEANRLLRELTT